MLAALDARAASHPPAIPQEPPCPPERSHWTPTAAPPSRFASPGPPIDPVESVAPLAVDTSGTDNLATITVPADHSVASMGASAPSGVRVATDKHVDVVARSPKTSICLGEAQGAGALDGLSVFSEGQKDEHIVDKVTIRYEDSADVEVGKELTTSSADRTDTVDGEWKADVTGDWNAKVKGKIEFTAGEDVEIKAKTNHNVWIQGSESKTVFGFTRERRFGGENTQLFGEKTELALAGAVELSSGYKREYFLGHKQGLHVGGGDDVHVT